MKPFVFILFIPFLLCCKQPDKITIDDYQVNFKELSRLLNEGEQKQIFRLSDNKKELVITRNGLKIEFDASKLVNEDGSLPDDSIDVVITECINQSDFIKSNVHTISDKLLLVSGGAYNIQMYCKGKPLLLKENDSLTIHLPKYSDDEMSLFYGQYDSVNQVNWTAANQSLSDAPKPSLLPVLAESDSINSPGEFEYYNPIKITRLGWINCDRFYKENNLVNLDYTFNNTEDTLVSEVLLIFKDINSVVSHYFIKSNKGIEYDAFENIPLGTNVRLVAVSVVRNQIFCYSEDLVTREKQNVEISLKPVTENELYRIINEPGKQYHFASPEQE